MKIKDQSEYLRFVEDCILFCGKNLLKKNKKKYVVLPYRDLQRLCKKYNFSHLIAQVSFHRDFKNEEYKLLKIMKLVLNKREKYIFPYDVVQRIKDHDETLICKIEKEGYAYRGEN